MATDCYALFKTTYNQAIADGLAVAVATAAAQSAMDDCLGQASAQNAPAVLTTDVPGGRLTDEGPRVGGVKSAQDRGSLLGTRQK